jgi:hypothetical protein
VTGAFSCCEVGVADHLAVIRVLRPVSLTWLVGRGLLAVSSRADGSYEVSLALERIMDYRVLGDSMFGILTRKPYPTDVSDEDWAYVGSYLALVREDAPQRTHDLREVFNAPR